MEYYDVGWDLKQVTTGVMVPKQLQREPKPPEEPGNRPLDQKGIFDAEYFVDPAGDLYSFADGTAKQVTTSGKVSYCDDDLIITQDGSLYLWEGQWVKKEGLPPCAQGGPLERKRHSDNDERGLCLGKCVYRG